MFASNVGVLIGLLFVGIEVRNSGNAVTAQSANAIADGFNQYNFLIASDPEIARIAHLGFRDPDKLTDSETIRATALIRGLFNQYEQVHTLYTSGVMADEAWARHARDMSRVINLPGAKLFLSGSAVFSDEFLTDVQRYKTLNRQETNTMGRGQIEFE